MKSCPTGKRILRNRHAALTALSHAQQHDVFGRRHECAVYRCERCGKWHLTSRRKVAA